MAEPDPAQVDLLVSWGVWAVVGWKRALGCSQPCAGQLTSHPGGTKRGVKGKGCPWNLSPGLSDCLVDQGLGVEGRSPERHDPFPRCWLPTRQLVSSRSSPTGKGSSASLGCRKPRAPKEREPRKLKRSSQEMPQPCPRAPQPTLEEALGMALWFCT